MRRVFVLIAFLVGAVLFTSACGKKVSGPVGVLLGPSIGEITTNPATFFGNDTVTFTATINGSGTITWTWDFDGGATPQTVSGSGSSASATVVVINNSQTEDATYEGTLTATDQFGTRTKTFTFTVGPLQNQAPVIESVTYADGVITVTASDPDGDPLTYEFTVTSGNVELTVSDNTAIVSAPGLGTFDFTVEVTVSDGRGGTATDSVSGQISNVPPQDNAIWMVAEPASASVGDTITIKVFGWNLANELRYLNTVHVAFSGNLEYVANSFDVGVPGGNWDIDGFWSLLGGVGGLAPGDQFEFLFGPYPKSQADYANDPAWADYDYFIEVNISPLPAVPGQDPTPAPAGSSDALFNFQVTATSAGTAKLRFYHDKTKYGLTSDGEFFFWDEQVLTIEIQ